MGSRLAALARRQSLAAGVRQGRVPTGPGPGDRAEGGRVPLAGRLRGCCPCGTGTSRIAFGDLPDPASAETTLTDLLSVALRPRIFIISIVIFIISSSVKHTKCRERYGDCE